MGGVGDLGKLGQWDDQKPGACSTGADCERFWEARFTERVPYFGDCADVPVGRVDAVVDALADRVKVDCGGLTLGDVSESAHEAWR